MITKENFKKVLEFLGFKEENNIFSKKFDEFDCELKADFQNEKLFYLLVIQLFQGITIGD